MQDAGNNTYLITQSVRIFIINFYIASIFHISKKQYDFDNKRFHKFFNNFWK